MLDAAPGRLLRVNRDPDANRLTDLLTFISHAILKSGTQIFGMQKLQNSMCHGGMSEPRG